MKLDNGFFFFRGIRFDEAFFEVGIFLPVRQYALHQEFFHSGQ
jgi:hypothetical protein